MISAYEYGSTLNRNAKVSRNFKEADLTKGHLFLHLALQSANGYMYG